MGYAFVTVTAGGYSQYGLCLCHYHSQWLVWAMFLSLSLPVVSVVYAFVTITASVWSMWAMFLSLSLAVVSVGYVFVTVTGSC